MPRITRSLAIGAGACLEIRRRGGLSAAALLAAAFAAALSAARLVGFENPAAATFALDLGITLSGFLALLAALVLASRQLPDEIERRTLHPMLARPVLRSEVLLGKWGAAVFSALALFAATILPVFLLVPRLEPCSRATLLQGLALFPLSVAFVAALGVAFSLWLPRAPGLLVAAAFAFGSSALVRLGASFPLLRALPAPSRLNLALRYTDGIGPLPASEFFLLAAYALLWIFLLLRGAARSFERRSL